MPGGCSSCLELRRIPASGSKSVGAEAPPTTKYQGPTPLFWWG
ncbi:DUF6053 domain-containing protein [Lysobacter sp. 2RAB21]